MWSAVLLHRSSGAVGSGGVRRLAEQLGLKGLIRLSLYREVAGTEEIAMQGDAGQLKSCTNSRIKVKTENI